MLPLTLTQDFAALVQVILIDVALAGDNAVVIGMAVAGLPAEQQRRAIVAGIAGATAIRVGFGAITLKLLEIIGLMLAGGLLLLWVCLKMFRELRRTHRLAETTAAEGKTLRAAMQQIILADISMSLDNVLAVAGAARGSFWVLATGLVLSIALMGLAAGLIARLLGRVRWIGWAGLTMVLYIALRMIWEGSEQVAAHTTLDERILSFLSAAFARLRP